MKIHLNHNFDDPKFDSPEYFLNIIGVTIPDGNKNPERILLKFTREQANYIATKPMHHSQKVVKETKSPVAIELTLIPNYELMKLIWSFGDSVEDLDPVNLFDRKPGAKPL